MPFYPCNVIDEGHGAIDVIHSPYVEVCGNRQRFVACVGGGNDTLTRF